MAMSNASRIAAAVAPIDILYVGFVLGHGGDANQMLELAAGAAARGKRVRIIVPILPTTVAFAETARQRNLDVVRTPLIRVSASAARQNPFSLAKLFYTNQAETIHIHTGDVRLPRTVPVVLAMLGIPRFKVFVTIHSPYDSTDSGGARETAWASAVRSRINGVACPSQHAVDAQIRGGVPQERLVHIPNGVNLNRFKSGDGARIRQELGLGSQDRLLVFTSRLEQQKRPMDALEAFSMTAAEFPDAHIAFVGTGALDADLRSFAASGGLEERVHLVGHRTDIPDWLAAATCWVLPTESENFSLAVLEALAAGCPIVSTLCKGNDEVLVDGYNAITHTIGDVAGLAGALRFVLSSSEVRQRLSAAANETSNRFGLDEMVESYIKWYSGTNL